MEAAPDTAGHDRDGETVLQRQLAGDRPRARTTALDAFKLARRKFLAGERVDMTALAAELGVNRVTLYRWVGSRNKLLVEVIWSLGSRTLEKERERETATGAERIVGILTRFIDAVLTNPGMSRFLVDEGDLCMRLLTRRDMDFQPRLIEAVRELLEEEQERGTIELEADLYDVAYTIVRIIESYVYMDRITGQQPDARRAEAILRMLLR